MKKPLIFLIAGLSLVVAGGVLAFLYYATPSSQTSETSNVTATIEQRCGTELRELYKNVYAVMLETCATAYKLESRTKDGADDFCKNQTANQNVNAAVMTSVCGTGQRIAVADKAAGTTASPAPPPSPRPASPSPSPSPRPATPSPQTQPTSSSQDPASNTNCAGGKGVKVGTGGLGTSCIGDASTNPIYVLIRVVAKWLIGLLGLVFVLIVVISGFQYIISRGKPDETKSAKDRLEHAVTGVILLVLMTAILNTLIPGGIL